MSADLDLIKCHLKPLWIWGPADGTCCSHVSRGSLTSLPWAELARYFCQLNILLTETCQSASDCWHLSGTDQPNSVPAPSSPATSQNSSVRRNGSGTSVRLELVNLKPKGYPVALASSVSFWWCQWQIIVPPFPSESLC